MATSNRTPIFPAELIFEITDILGGQLHYEEDEPSGTALKTLALVSHILLPQAQKHLFRKIHLNDTDRLNTSSIDWLASVLRMKPGLSDLIKIIHLQKAAYVRSNADTAIADILGRVRNLTVFNLDFEKPYPGIVAAKWHDMDPRIKKVLKQALLAGSSKRRWKLEQLYLTGVDKVPLYVITHVPRTLKVLELDSIYFSTNKMNIRLDIPRSESPEGNMDNQYDCPHAFRLRLTTLRVTGCLPWMMYLLRDPSSVFMCTGPTLLSFQHIESLEVDVATQ
ncbi:hypothetical protein BDQ17DRAFT_1429394 [Cyathus striatus]|nr:hypothetical protein BDQ17DRAFT_1429394 [Cyathus striatus]